MTDAARAFLDLAGSLKGRATPLAELAMGASFDPRLDMAMELVARGELVVAMENLISNLSDFNVAVTADERDVLVQLAVSLNISADRRQHITELPSDDVVLVDPWWDLRGGAELDAAERDRIARQLAAEVAPGHPLHELPVDVIGRSAGGDDVLVRARDRRWAVVHLSYQGRQRPPWPSTTFFDSSAKAEQELAAWD